MIIREAFAEYDPTPKRGMRVNKMAASGEGFTRDDIVDYMLLYWKLAYYRAYFPEEYLQCRQ